MGQNYYVDSERGLNLLRGSSDAYVSGAITYSLSFPAVDLLTSGTLNDLSWQEVDLGKLNIALSSFLSLRIFISDAAKSMTEKMIVETEGLIGQLEEASSQKKA